MKRAHTTPPFRTEDGAILADSIAEAGFVSLGGLDQWVMIRGEDRDNPVLVVLHGGPGFSDTAFLRYHTPALERRFTLVYWDQRGAGRSYRPDIPPASMTAAQLLADLDELVDHVRRRLGQPQVALLGHSWGTVLGALYAARFPEKLTVYVGVAQIGDWPAAEAASYAQTLAAARRAGRRRILRKLRAIGPPPYDADAVFVERTAALRLAGGLSPRALWDTARMLLGAPEGSLLELRATMRAFHFSMDRLWPEVSRLDLCEAVPALAVPVVFMLGRRDPWVPPETSVAYFERLRAPAKQLVWFEASGHEPFVDEPSHFVKAMLAIVRPLCRPAPAEASALPA